MIHDLHRRVGVVSALLALVALTTRLRGAEDVLVLVGGDRLTVEIVSTDDAGVVFDHAALGRMRLGWDRIHRVELGEPPPEAPDHPPAAVARVIPAPPPANERADDAAAHLEEQAEAEPAWRRRLDRWDISIDLSLNSATGNTDEQSVRFGAKGVRLTERTRLKLDTAYYLKVSDGATTDNNLTLGVRNDWLRPGSRLFYFAQGRYDFDEFESWLQRVQVHAGPGYHLVKTERHELDLVGGLGVRREFGSINDAERLEALLGVDYRWRINDRQSLELDARYYPVIGHAGDYRFTSNGSWRLAVSEQRNLALLLGYSFEYQSVVDPGKANEDLRVYTGLQLSF